MIHIDTSQIAWRNQFERIKDQAQNRRKGKDILKAESAIFARALVQAGRSGVTIEKNPRELNRIIHRAARYKLSN